MPKNPEGSVQGRGEAEMLPGRGNPFEAALDSSPFATPEPPAPSTENTPQSPAPPVDYVPPGILGRPGPDNFDDLPPEEARDLDPDEVMFLFKMKPRTPASPPPKPVSLPSAAPAAALDVVPVAAPPIPLTAASETSAEISAVSVALSPAEPPASSPGRVEAPLGSAPSGWVPSAAPAAEEPADTARGSGLPLPSGSPFDNLPSNWAPGAPSADRPADAAPALGDAPASGSPAASGVRLMPETLQPPGSDLGGIRVFDSPAALAGDHELVDKYLVTNARLIQLWGNIDNLESELTSSKIGNIKLVQELLDRLQAARNYLMADRLYYEEAERQVAEVKYRMTSALRVRTSRGPKVLFVYLMFCLVLLGLGFLAGADIEKLVAGKYAGAELLPLWFTLMWGGIGGVTGALYALWVHVARDQDYDPQFNLWYITNPIMGVVLGAFVYLIMRGGIISLFGGQSPSGPGDSSTLVYYLLAWLVGFQQNLAFSLANLVMTKLIPRKTTESTDTGAQALKEAQARAGLPRQP